MPDKESELAFNRIEKTLRVWNERESIRYSNNLKLYTGKHYSLASGGRGEEEWKAIHELLSADGEDLTVSNYVLPNINTAVASIAGLTPDFRVEAEDDYCKDREGWMTALANGIWKIVKGDRQCKKVARDAYTFGKGFVGIGWVYEDDKNRDEGEGGRQKVVGIRQSVIRDDAELFRISYRDSFPDPYADDSLGEDWRFWFWRERKPLEQLLKLSIDKFYGKDIDDIIQMLDRAIIDSEKTGDGRVEIYHYYDRDGWYRMFMKDNGEPLKSRDDYFHFPSDCIHPFPVEVLPYTEVPDTQQCLSMGEIIRDEQQGLNRMTRRMFQYVKAAIPKKQIVGTDGEDIDAMERALMSEKVNQIVEVRSELKDIPIPPLPSDFWNIRQTLINQITEKLGILDYSRSKMPDRRETATASKILAVLGGTRANEEGRVFRDFVIRIIRKLIWLYSSDIFGDRTRRFCHTNRNTGKKVSYEGDWRDCAGSWKITIYAGSMEQKDKDFMKEAAAILLQTLTPLIVSGDVNIVPILKEFLSAWDIVSVDDVINDTDEKELINVMKALPEDIKELVMILLKDPELLGQTLKVLRDMLQPQLPEGGQMAGNREQVGENNQTVNLGSIPIPVQQPEGIMRNLPEVQQSVEAQLASTGQELGEMGYPTGS